MKDNDDKVLGPMTTLDWDLLAFKMTVVQMITSIEKKHGVGLDDIKIRRETDDWYGNFNSALTSRAYGDKSFGPVKYIEFELLKGKLCSPQGVEVPKEDGRDSEPLEDGVEEDPELVKETGELEPIATARELESLPEIIRSIARSTARRN